MARRLMAHIDGCELCGGLGTIGSIRVQCPQCADDRAAIRKAGVLP